MSDDRRYVVKNWRQFQHYKDRNPPWVKLHFTLLSSRDWVTLDDASRVLAVASMLIASRNDGEIDGSEAGLEYLQRVAYTNTKPNLKPLIDCGFLVHASVLLAPSASALLANSVAETEKEKKNLTGKPARAKAKTRKASRGNGKVNSDPPTSPTWAAYSLAYEKRYSAQPTRNAKVSGMLSRFIARVPIDDAPAIAAHYVASDRGLYVSAHHCIDLLLRDAEALRTEWMTGTHSAEPIKRPSADYDPTRMHF